MKKIILCSLLACGLGLLQAQPSGNCVYFDGINNSITIPLPVIAGNSQFTFAAWVKQSPNSHQDYVMGNYPGDAVLYLGAFSSDYLIFYGGGSYPYGWTGPFELQDNVWNHVAVISQNGALTTFVNGQIYMSGTIGTVPGSTNFWIGGTPDSQADQHFEGFMDEVAVWDTALTQTEIQALMTGHPDTSNVNLLAYWNMDRTGAGAGLTVVNSSQYGNMYEGTTYGSANTPYFTPSCGVAMPSVSGAAVCGPDSVSFVVNGTLTYNWYSDSIGGILLHTGPIYSVYLGQTDTFYVAAVDTCESIRSMVIGTVNSLPVVTWTLPADTLCLDDAIMTLSGESPAGGIFSGPAILGNTFDPGAAGVGNYALQYVFTDQNGCTDSASANITVDICTGDSREKPVVTVMLLPNPATSLLTIQLNEFVPGSVAEILDASGKLVTSFRLNAASTTVDVSQWSTGVYGLRISSAEQAGLIRFIVE